MTDAAGVAGAALIISNKRTGNVEEACFQALANSNATTPVDPYSPLLDGSWVKLSECLPNSMLRKSERYNDFELACGVRDILGARPVDTISYRVIFGIHQPIGHSFSERLDSVVSLVRVPLKYAAWRYPFLSDQTQYDR